MTLHIVIAHEELDGAIDPAAPKPLPKPEFMPALCRAAGGATGFPSSRLMFELGAWFLRTENELILKSRPVIPDRLLASGFNVQFPDWAGAARDLVLRYRTRRIK